MRSFTLCSDSGKQYTATDILGEGGSGVVYKAADESGRFVAVKRLRATANSTARGRFINEMHFCRTIENPNIVSVIDMGTPDKSGELFYVMRLYDMTLRKLIAAGIHHDDILPYFRQIMNGVNGLHERGVVHRDLKPENILIDSNDKRALIGDLGIAHFMEADLVSPVKTKDSDRVANFGYPAPEQRMPGCQVGQSADIYALGLMLNEMFTGHVPHGTDYITIAQSDIRFAGLDGLIAEMIRQDPTRRIASVAEVLTKIATTSLAATVDGFTKLSPDNRALPVFYWKPTPGASAYEIAVDSADLQLIRGHTSFVVRPALDAGTHQVRIRAIDAEGRPGQEMALPFITTVAPELKNTTILFRTSAGLSLLGIYETTPRTLIADGYAYRPAWSPDGEKIAYTTYDGGYKLNIVGRDGKNVITVIDMGSGATPNSPRWSPDGESLLFLAPGGIFRVGVNHRVKEKFLAMDCGEFDLSPDGRRMAFIIRNGNIVISNVDGGEAITYNAPQGRFNTRPRWSPDGERIVFCQAEKSCTSAECSTADIFWMQSDGAGVENLTNNRVKDSNPSWSPDGRMLAFYSEGHVGSGIYVMNVTDHSVARVCLCDEKAIERSMSAFSCDVEWSPFVSR